MTYFTRMAVERAGKDGLMASQSFEPHAAAGSFYGSSPTFNRSYLMAAMRAAAIALLLLGVLALIVVF